jgi:flagellar M-ring protein FliF
MDILNQSLNQIRDLFASMTPGARLTSVLLAGVIAVSLGFLATGYSGGADELLFNGEFLLPREADRVDVAIAKAGLENYRREGNRFYVPRGQKAAYLAAVADAGALPANFDTLMDSLEVSPFVSSEELEQRMKSMRERQISMIVRQMQGVEDAQVLYDIREPKGFGKRQITATVSVQPDAAGALTPERTKMIREAVAGAIAGLNPADVTLLNLGDGGQIAGGTGEISAESFDEPYFVTRTRYEQLMRGKVQDLLDFIPGARVQVSAELDEALARETRSVKSEGEAVAVVESRQEERTTSVRNEDRGRPGLEAQGPGRRAADERVATDENEGESTNSDTQNFVPTTELVLRESGLVPKNVRVAIAIPSDYLVRVWREQNPTAEADAAPPPAEIENLKKNAVLDVRTVVRPLLTKELGKDPFDNIEVSVFQSLTPTPIEPPSLADSALVWASQNFDTLVLAGLAAVSLLMLRSLVKSTPPAAPVTAYGSPALALDLPASEPGPAASGANREQREPDGKDKRQRLKLRKGPSLRDDLTEIVREDPDAAAAILRSWIGNAA